MKFHKDLSLKYSMRSSYIYYIYVQMFALDLKKKNGLKVGGRAKN